MRRAHKAIQDVTYNTVCRAGNDPGIDDRIADEA
jgi:hypothetical protein